MCILYTQYIYTAELCMSTSGIVIHFITKAINPLTLRRYTVLNGNFVFDLRNVYQEHNPGIKRDFPVLSSYILLDIQSIYCVRFNH